MGETHSMRIGIDISQLAYPNTGVSNYLNNLVIKLLEKDRENEYILFFSSLRRKCPLISKNATIKTFKLPPTVLNIVWNTFHILPIELFIGNVDIFITSDWTEPPTKSARKMTILYDMVVYKSIKETDKKIVNIQKKKLEWVKKESSKILCISESTKKDAEEILGIDKKRLEVVYPGL